MKKKTNLQPWLDYFGMLQTYEEKGLLRADPGKHEAYVTEAALCTLSSADTQTDGAGRLRSYGDVVRRLRAYAGWRSQEGNGYLKENFAVHVVKDDMPHDPVCTVLLERRRRWWSLFRMTDCFEVVGYDTREGL